MRHLKSGRPHGIVRIVKADSILEATMKDGQMHGLQREVVGDQVHVKLFKSSYFMAELVFDKELQEVSRNDALQMLHRVKASDFGK